MALFLEAQMKNGGKFLLNADHIISLAPSEANPTTRKNDHGYTIAITTAKGTNGTSVQYWIKQPFELVRQFMEKFSVTIPMPTEIDETQEVQTEPAKVDG